MKGHQVMDCVHECAHCGQSEQHQTVNCQYRTTIDGTRVLNSIAVKDTLDETKGMDVDRDHKNAQGKEARSEEVKGRDAKGGRNTDGRDLINDTHFGGKIFCPKTASDKIQSKS
jgi:hypothetical protein